MAIQSEYNNVAGNDMKAMCRDAVWTNLENLKMILKENAETEFGKEHHFADIETVEDYRKAVPLSDYTAYQDAVRRMLAGEENILTAYPLAGFCRTSGTSGKQKLIPVTFRGLERYTDYIERYKNQFFKEQRSGSTDGTGKRFLVNLFRVDSDEEQNLSEPILLSWLYYRFLLQSGRMNPDDYAGGKETLFSRECTDSLYVKAWIALVFEDILVMESIFLYDQLLFLQYLEKNWEVILTDIRLRRIPEERQLPPNLQRILLNLPVSQKRLDEVKKQCEAGFEGIAVRLWPRLKLASGISNPAFFAEDAALKRYLKGVSIHYFSYVSSECHIGVALASDDCRFVMLPKSAFMEYLPYEEGKEKNERNEKMEKTQTLLPDQLEVGKQYELVLTNFCGLYRYCLGDVVRVAGFFYESPLVEFMFRKNQVLNLAGDKITAVQVEQAVRKLRQVCHLKVSEYCIGPLEGKIPGRYAAVFSGVEFHTAADDTIKGSEMEDGRTKDYAMTNCRRTENTTENNKIKGCMTEDSEIKNGTATDSRRKENGTTDRALEGSTAADDGTISVRINEIARQLDLALQEQNLDYKELREIGDIGRPEILFLNGEEYAAFMKEGGFGKGHNKPCHTSAAGFSERLWEQWKKRN